MQIIVNFTNDEKETLFRELKDSDVMTSEIERFESELKVINSLEKRFKGMKLFLVNDKIHLGCTIYINSSLFSKIANLAKKFISKFFAIFKMAKEFAADCDLFDKATDDDAKIVSTSLNGYKVPDFFVSMGTEERKSHVMGELLNAATSNSPIKGDVRNMAASLMDKDIDNFVINIDNKQKLQQNLNLVPSNDRS